MGCQVQISAHFGNHRISLVIHKKHGNIVVVPLYHPLPFDIDGLDGAEIYLEAEKLELDICLRKYDPFDDKVVEILGDYFCINHH
jgi:hypothetical protein